MILRHLQRCGHRPVVLLGGGTSRVGDPTGKDASRPLLGDDVIAANVAGISRVFRKFLNQMIGHFAVASCLMRMRAHEEEAFLHACRHSC
jgi:tyrosyl-tRNA synthetase